ncbi:hypothetical protein GVN18_41505 [Pseudomonas sp. ODNR1LW]|nr:hypothetical protein [Pseudomonas sp. ODNR1LW]
MEWAARAIGVFYVLGGLMLLYQAWLNWRLQRALAGLVAIPIMDHVGDGVVALAGALILASGAALAALSGWAVVAFLAGWTVQALYLLLTDPASRAAAPAAPAAARCRRRSVHAFTGYTAATGLVLCLPMVGVLG